MRRQDDFVVGLVVIMAVVAVTGMALWLSRAQFGASSAPVVARTREVGGARSGRRSSSAAWRPGASPASI